MPAASLLANFPKWDPENRKGNGNPLKIQGNRVVVEICFFWPDMKICDEKLHFTWIFSVTNWVNRKAYTGNL